MRSSHLIGWQDYVDLLAAAGLQLSDAEDVTGKTIAWSERVVGRPTDVPAPLGVEGVIGEDFRLKNENLLWAMKEGLVSVYQAVFSKPISGA